MGIDWFDLQARKEQPVARACRDVMRGKLTSLRPKGSLKRLTTLSSAGMDSRGSATTAASKSATELRQPLHLPRFAYRLSSPIAEFTLPSSRTPTAVLSRRRKCLARSARANWHPAVRIKLVDGIFAPDLLVLARLLRKCRSAGHWARI